MEKDARRWAGPRRIPLGRCRNEIAVAVETHDVRQDDGRQQSRRGGRGVVGRDVALGLQLFQHALEVDLVGAGDAERPRDLALADRGAAPGLAFARDEREDVFAGGQHGLRACHVGMSVQALVPNNRWIERMFRSARRSYRTIRPVATWHS